MAGDILDTLRAAWMARRDRPLPAIPEARDNLATVMAAMPVAEDVGFAQTSAGNCPAVWLTPHHCRTDRVLLYFHGGGFAIGDPSTHRGLAGALARAATARALSVDYRRAPEHPFPAGLEDCAAAYRWLLDAGTPARHIVMAGDSAGAGLALSCLLQLRDAGLPLPRGAVLMCPWVDLTLTGESFRDKVDVDPLLTQDMLRTFAEIYLADASPTAPLASPLAADLAGLPPLFIQVGSDDLLLDDATRLAARAAAAGVKVRLDVWPRMVHVWQACAPLIDAGRQAIDEAGEFIERLFSD